MFKAKLFNGDNGSQQAAGNRFFKNAFLKMRNLPYKLRPGEITPLNASANYLDYMARAGQKFTGKEVDAVVSSSGKYLNTYGEDMFPYICAGAKGKCVYLVPIEGAHKGEVLKVQDTFNFYGVAAGAGHANRKIIRALAKTMEKGAMCSRNFYSPQLAALSDYLLGEKGIFAQMLPGYGFYMLSSGSESIDAALKLACEYQNSKREKRDTVIVMENGFHGRTGYALNMADRESIRGGYFGIGAEVKVVKFGDAFSLMEAFRSNKGRIISVLFEPVQGETGVVPAPKGYLALIRRLCDAEGALMIADEVQTFARTGHWFASTGLGATPDILVTGKITSGGLYPASIIYAGPGIKFRTHGHGNTYTGSPAACTVVLETLKHIRKNNLLQNSEEVGAYILSSLSARLSGNKKVAEVRGMGSMVGIELAGVSDGQRQEYCHNAVLQGVLVTAAGDNALRMLLPLSLTRNDADQITEALAKVLEK